MTRKLDANSFSQTVNDQANNAYLQANTAYLQANNARNTANSAYAQANTGSGIAKSFLTGTL